MIYQEMLSEMIPEGIDPRHVEAHIRLRHATLDGLSWKDLEHAADLAVKAIGIEGKEMAERLAQTFGL